MVERVTPYIHYVKLLTESSWKWYCEKSRSRAFFQWAKTFKKLFSNGRIIMVNLPLKAEAAHMWWKTSAYMLQVYEYTNLINKIENVSCRLMPFPLWHGNLPVYIFHVDPYHWLYTNLSYSRLLKFFRGYFPKHVVPYDGNQWLLILMFERAQ